MWSVNRYKIRDRGHRDHGPWSWSADVVRRSVVRDVDPWSLLSVMWSDDRGRDVVRRCGRIVIIVIIIVIVVVVVVIIMLPCVERYLDQTGGRSILCQLVIQLLSTILSPEYNRSCRFEMSSNYPWHPIISNLHTYLQAPLKSFESTNFRRYLSIASVQALVDLMSGRKQSAMFFWSVNKQI